MSGVKAFITLSQKDLPLSIHADAPLSIEGRRRLVERCRSGTASLLTEDIDTRSRVSVPRSTATLASSGLESGLRRRQMT